MRPKESSLKNSRFGLGLAALGRPAYMTVDHQRDLPRSRTVANVERHAHQVMDEAYRQGIRYFDAAASYGKSEQFLQDWLAKRKLTPKQLRIGSKWGYRYVGGWKLRVQVHEVKDHSVEALRSQWAETHARLDGFLSLYQIHSATLETGVLHNDAVLDELARIRDDGVTVGLTVTGADQPALIDAALEVKRGGSPLFGAVQATWNLFERSATEALARAHDRGVKVIVKEPLSNGKLTVRGDPERIAPLLQLAKRRRTTPDVIALAAVLKQRWADTVLLGAATKAQLRSNLVSAAFKLSAAELRSLDALIVPSADYWQERKSLPWK